MHEPLHVVYNSLSLSLSVYVYIYIERERYVNSCSHSCMNPLLCVHHLNVVYLFEGGGG